MKVLVAAKRIALDDTSEGICTAKLLNLLAMLGHQVRCATDDRSALAAADGGAVRWIPDVHIVGVQNGAPSVVGRRLDAIPKARGLLRRATGLSMAERAAVAAWRATLGEEVRSFGPDVVLVRGAGHDFTPHLAMVALDPDVPWVANYHDPWPLCIYPEPYRSIDWGVARAQRRQNQRIIDGADRLTFPSRRLLEWELTAARRHASAVVVPHLGAEPALLHRMGIDLSDAPPARLADDPVRIVHAGYLSRQRDPSALLTAVQHATTTTGAGRIELELIGGFDEKLLLDPARRDLIASLEASKVLTRTTRRVGYGESLALVRGADVAVVLDVGRPQSPFFPGKLADLLSLGVPILALAPRDSVVRDVLGEGHPLLAEPDDAAQIGRCLRAIASAAADGELAQLVVTPQVAAAVSCDTVAATVADACGPER